MEQLQQPQKEIIDIESSTLPVQPEEIDLSSYSEKSSTSEVDDEEEYKVQKTKKISKAQKSKKKTEKRKTKTEKKVKIDQRKAADCNNFGKLLIGTVVDNIIKVGQIIQGNFVKIIFEDQQKVINLNNAQISLKLVLQIIQILKKIAMKIPRKNGDRKNLNPIFNINDQQFRLFDEIKKLNLQQNELRVHVEIAKHILREELLFIFNQKKWIQTHSSQKKFKTDVNLKRLNYQKYLQNVRNCLENEKSFPKIIGNKYEFQTETVQN